MNNFNRCVLAYNPDIMKILGNFLVAAIVSYVYYWVTQNHSAQRLHYCVDGVFWTHCTKGELLKKFHGFERRTFDRTLKKLINMGVIVKKKDHRTAEEIWLTFGPKFAYFAEVIEDKYFLENCVQSCVYPVNNTDAHVDNFGGYGQNDPSYGQNDLSYGQNDPSYGQNDPSPSHEPASVAAPRPVDKTQQRRTDPLHIKNVQLTDPTTTTKGDLSTAQKKSLSSDQDRQIAKLTMKQKAELAASEIFDATTKAPSNFGFNEKDPNMINRIYSLAGRLCILPKKLRPFFKHYTACEIWIQLNNLKYAEKMNDIKNPVGWLSAALEKNYDTCEAAFDFYQSYKLLAEKEMRERI
jgi:hypothetical protein